MTPVRCEAIIRTRDCLLSIEQTSVKFAPKYDGLHSKWIYIVCTVATPLGLDVFRKINIDIISNFHYRYIHTYIWITSISVWHLLLNNVEGAQGNNISYELSGTMFWFNSIRPRDICVSKLGHRWGDSGLICALNDVIMGTIASQITSLTTVYSTVYSDEDQRKLQISAPPAFVRRLHRGAVNSTYKWPATWKILPFDDVIMAQGCFVIKLDIRE